MIQNEIELLQYNFLILKDFMLAYKEDYLLDLLYFDEKQKKIKKIKEILPATKTNISFFEIESKKNSFSIFSIK